MKKTPKPFTFEIKRSRRPARQRSSFQRYVLAPEQVEHMSVAGLFKPADKARAASSPLPLAHVNPAVVPPEGLIADPLPQQEDMPAPFAAGETEPEPTSMMGARADDSASSEPAEGNRLQAPSGRKRRMMRMAADLPRGERWKRRLPQVAW